MTRHSAEGVYTIRCWMWIVLSLLIIVCSFSVLCPMITIGPSMLPTLENGQLLGCIPAGGNSATEIHRGDVVILRAPGNKKLVKRVIAVPQDRLAIVKDQVFVNGQRLKEPYIAEPMKNSKVVGCILKEDQYFVLGDNRNISADSRYYGTFSREDILAVVQLENRQLMGFLSILPTILAILMLFAGIQYEDSRYKELYL